VEGDGRAVGGDGDRTETAGIVAEDVGDEHPDRQQPPLRLVGGRPTRR